MVFMTCLYGHYKTNIKNQTKNTMSKEFKFDKKGTTLMGTFFAGLAVIEMVRGYLMGKPFNPYLVLGFFFGVFLLVIAKYYLK